MKLWHNNTELSLPISLCFLPSDSLYQWLCHFLHLTLPSLLFPTSTIWRLLVALCCLYHLLTKFRFVRVSEWQKSVCPQLFFLSPFFTLDRLIFFETVILAFNLVSLLPLHSFLFHLSVFLFFLFFVFVLCFVFFLSFLLDSCVLWPKKKLLFILLWHWISPQKTQWSAPVHNKGDKIRYKRFHLTTILNLDADKEFPSNFSL